MYNFIIVTLMWILCIVGFTYCPVKRVNFWVGLFKLIFVFGYAYLLANSVVN